MPTHICFFSRNTSGYCTNDFTPRIQNGTFDCLAGEAGGGEDQLVNGYFRLDNLASNFSSNLPPRKQLLRTSLYSALKSTCPPLHTFLSPYRTTRRRVDCGYAFPDQLITYKTKEPDHAGKFHKNTSTNLRGALNAWHFTTGWLIGTRLRGWNCMRGHMALVSSVHETFPRQAFPIWRFFGVDACLAHVAVACSFEQPRVFSHLQSGPSTVCRAL